MYQPQQFEVVTEILRAMEDRQITVLETQNILNAALSFGMSLVFMTALGTLVRSFVIEALEEPDEEKALPVIGAILPETEKEARRTSRSALVTVMAEVPMTLGGSKW